MGPRRPVQKERNIHIAQKGQLSLITLHWRCPIPYTTNTCRTKKLSIITRWIFQMETSLFYAYINVTIAIECKIFMVTGISNCIQSNYFKIAVMPSVINKNLRPWNHIVVKIIQECIIFARNTIHILIKIQQI